MKQIGTINIARLRVQEDFGFQKQILAETERLTAELDAKMVATYKAAVDEFDAALKVSEGSLLTASLADADQKADEAWSGLYATVKAQLNHPLEENKAAAVKAMAVLKKYGNITSQPYNEEYGNMYNLLQDLDELGDDVRKLCYIDAWATALHERYDEFIAIRKERTSEDAAKVQGIVKTTRTACDEAYKKLVSCVNVLVTLQGEDAYADFIDNVNVIIASSKATLAARTTRAANSKKAAKE